MIFSLLVKLNNAPGDAHRLADKLCEAAVDFGERHDEAGCEGGQVEDLEGGLWGEGAWKRQARVGGIGQHLKAVSLAMRSCLIYTEQGTCGHQTLINCDYFFPFWFAIFGILFCKWASPQFCSQMQVAKNRN